MMPSLPTNPLMQSGPDAPSAPTQAYEPGHPNYAPSHFWLKPLAGFVAAGLVAYILMPLLSAPSGSASGDPISPVGLIFALGIFGLTTTIVLRAPTPRAALGRSLLCVAAALFLAPASTGLLLVLHLQDWATILSGTALHQTGSIASSLFGGLVIANVLVFGLIVAGASLLIRRALA